MGPNTIEEDGEEKKRKRGNETLDFNVPLGDHLVLVLHTAQTHNCFLKPSLIIRLGITLS